MTGPPGLRPRRNIPRDRMHLKRPGVRSGSCVDCGDCRSKPVESRRRASHSLRSADSMNMPLSFLSVLWVFPKGRARCSCSSSGMAPMASKPVREPRGGRAWPPTVPPIPREGARAWPPVAGRRWTERPNEYGAAEAVLAAVGQLTPVTLPTTLAAPLRKEVQMPAERLRPAGGPRPLVRPDLEWGGHVDHNHERAPIWESSYEHEGLSK
jgi:hypothetical protein